MNKAATWERAVSPAHGDGDPLPSLAFCMGCTEAFLAEHWNARPFVSPGPPGRFADTFSMREMDRLLSMGAVRGTHLTMVKPGFAVPLQRFTRRAWAFGQQELTGIPDCARIAELIRNGYTLQVGAVDQVSDGLGRLCAGLESELCHRVWASVFITSARAQGIAVHSDRHAVIALQVQGCKKWDIYRPRSGPPRLDRSVALDPEEQPVLSAVLHPGDALYVPPGFVHEVKSLEDLSVHVSIAIVQATLADFLRYAVDWCARRPELGASLPPGFGTEAGDAVPLVRDGSARLARMLRDDATMAEAFAAFSAAWLSKRRHGSPGFMTALAETAGHPSPAEPS
jgi:bifunctional lysine-specific demethylase and histidyl-hydroxylase NO66